MTLKTLSITSDTTTVEFSLNSPVCILRGKESAYYLDIIRELIGNNPFWTPDIIDDGSFIIHADIDLDGKNYSLCYLRNADYVGDCRIAANFELNSTKFSHDDTEEYLRKIKARGDDYSNVFELVTIAHDNDIRGESDRLLSGLESFIELCKAHPDDTRPIFIYDFLERIDMSVDIKPYFDKLTSIGRQVFIAIPEKYQVKQFKNAALQEV